MILKMNCVYSGMDMESSLYYLIFFFLPFCFFSGIFCCSFFLATLHSLGDLSSRTRDWTWALAVKVTNPNHWLLLFSHSFMFDSLWPHGLQHTRLPCASLSPRVCSNSRPLSQWCHPTISSSVVPFSSCPRSFPASGSFPISWLFPSGGQSIGASASVLPMNIHGTAREIPLLPHFESF